MSQPHAPTARPERRGHTLAPRSTRCRPLGFPRAGPGESPPRAPLGTLREPSGWGSRATPRGPQPGKPRRLVSPPCGLRSVPGPADSKLPGDTTAALVRTLPGQALRTSRTGASPGPFQAPPSRFGSALERPFEDPSESPCEVYFEASLRYPVQSLRSAFKGLFSCGIPRFSRAWRTRGESLEQPEQLRLFPQTLTRSIGLRNEPGDGRSKHPFHYRTLHSETLALHRDETAANRHSPSDLRRSARGLCTVWSAPY